ncbi:hypothetical protein V5P93_006770 [Actinokineospora auranticolor]|uniref:Uncharacterized protein n=1 Tax=Actinokineospora auranticolor TaxID=155976 RepID=A0A2S6GWG6_9PSEU|nr:hypothetical protein [Actinokineospora auranticolor]PPK69585.1 hypothetical protein CLV40_103195 [Actinokineospora auranticolor]
MTAEQVRAALTAPTGADLADTADALVEGPLAEPRGLLSPRAGGAVYRRWRAHPAAKGGWTPEPWGPADERMVDDLRNAEFGGLAAARDRLAALAKAAEALREGAAGLRTRLSDTWGGRGADTAATRFDQLSVAARTWHDGLLRLATALDGGRGVAADALHGWAAQAATLRGIAVDNLANRQDQIDRLDAALRSYTPAQLRTPGTLNLNGIAEDPWPSAEVIDYLDDYCGRYAAAVARFRADLRAVHDATAQGWRAFTDAIRAVDPDPFTAVTPSSSTAPSAAVPTGTAPSGAATGESVTIREGGRAITVDSSMGITVDRGDGKPTKYVVDSAPSPQPAPKPAAASAAADTPGTPAPDAAATPSEAGVPAGGSAGGSVGGGGAAVGGGGGTSAGQPPLQPGAMTNAEAPPSQESRAGVGGSAPAAAGPAAGAGMAGGGMGGMPMGGGGGGQGGGGGDTDRKASQWRLVGSLFDDNDPAAFFDGVVGEDPANRAKG